MGKLSGLSRDDKLKHDINNAEKKAIKKWVSLQTDPIICNKLMLSGGFVDFMDKEFEQYKLGAEPFSVLNTHVTKLKHMIERSDYHTIFIVSHSGLLDVLIQKLLGTHEYRFGDFDNGKNCWISLIELNQNTYRMTCSPNTEHLRDINNKKHENA